MTVGTVWAHAWRTVVVGGMLAVAAPWVFLSGLGGRPLGILWAALVLGAGTALVTGLLWWRRPGRVGALSLAVPLAIVLGIAIGVRTPPGPVVLGDVLASIALPGEAEVVATSSGGNVLCFDVCPTARRTVVVPGEPEEVAEAVRGALRDAGYELQDPVDPRSFTTALDDEREWYVAGRAEPAPGGRGTRLELRAVASG